LGTQSEYDPRLQIGFLGSEFFSLGRARTEIGNGLLGVMSPLLAEFRNRDRASIEWLLQIAPGNLRRSCRFRTFSRDIVGAVCHVALPLNAGQVLSTAARSKRIRNPATRNR
jgi:hypothetical protein